MNDILSHRYCLVDDDLIAKLQDSKERKSWLFLDVHPDFKGHWSVESFDPAFFFDFKDLVGSYKVVAPAKLAEFLTLAEDFGYNVAFFEDPMKLMDHYEHLNETPKVSLNSSLTGTINGMLPFQARGFNFLNSLSAGVVLWSTGTGKSAIAAALTKYNLVNFDIVLHVVKAHNKINTQRSLRRLTDIESIVIDGTKAKRIEIYRELVKNDHRVAILNYEKFRTDKDEIKVLLEGRRVMIVWDEMPTKLKTRSTQIYKAVCECLYRTSPPAVDWSKRRPKELKQYMLSATPIENSPEDFFNCVRLLDPNLYGTVAKFRDEYVARYSYFDPHTPESWHNLDKMGLTASHIIHEVDKETDPDVKAQFPGVLAETCYIDWDDKDRKIYDLLTKKARKLLDLEDANILALTGVMQMLCDAPSMVKNSAAIREAYEGALEAWGEYGGEEPTKEGSEVAMTLLDALGSNNLTDERHTKLSALKELLCETHPDEKSLVFSAFNEGLMPVLETKLKEWGVTYVRYKGTPKQKQAAQDEFMDNPDIQVFLTSDMGSDSLSLEQANVVIHYDLPWKWSTYTQRENRVHRVVSEHDAVRYYTLVMADSVEDRKMEIIQRKLGYHDQIFKGAIADQAASATMTRQDLLYVLTGVEPS